MDLNKWVGVGRLTCDPRMVGNSDSPNRIVFFSISNERGRKDKKHINYFDCIAYTGLADLIFKHCKKGDRIGMDGELKHKKISDRKTGRTKERDEIVVYNVQFLFQRNKIKDSQEDFKNLNNY